MYSKYIGRKKEENLTWGQLTDIYNEENGTDYKWPTLRMRIINNISGTKKEEYETYFNNGTIEAQKVVNLPRGTKENPDKVLEILGYDPLRWEIVFMKFSIWEAHTREQSTKELYAVQYKLKPKNEEVTEEEVKGAIEKYIKTTIKPLKLPKRKKQTGELLIECPAIELHLGKLAHHIDTGENYDHKIASQRFRDIIAELIEYQSITKATELMITIGGDFFNSDTYTNETTAGTPQHNDMRFQKMFLVGLSLYTESLLKLREIFDTIRVNLNSGNHDKMSSFYLYIALGQRFQNDSIISFSNEYKSMQVYEFGDNAIFTHHGDFKGRDYKRIIQTIAYEFHDIWGRCRNRELHLGHLHTEQMIDEHSGLIIRRVGSPSGTDLWHYENRYIGSRKAHQFFLWHKIKGMINTQYVVWEE